VSIGPIEYLLIEFPGNKFTGEIVPALGRLIENRTVRILDLVFIRTDASGTRTTLEFDQLDELAPFAALDGEAGGLVSKEDIAYAGARAPAELVGRLAGLGGHAGDRVGPGHS
jgi:hypothetical protein